MSRPRPRTIAIGALIALLVAAPFVPRGSDHDGSLRPSGDNKASGLRPAATAGSSQITPQMQTEIDRVVAQGRSVGRLGTKASSTQIAASAVRCAELDGQRYCLGYGWTDRSEQQVQARMARAAKVAARNGDVVNTGDLDAAAQLRQFARMSPSARAASERAELEDAARSVAKVWLLRHEIQGVPLPADFLAEHPEAAASTAPAVQRSAASKKATKKPTATPTNKPTDKPSNKPSDKPTADPTSAPVADTPATQKTAADYPKKVAILKTSDVREQTRTYWCGPTSMQMIAWGWKGKARSQAHWAKLLGTTSAGTGITDMVRVTNAKTGWDRKDHAGRYITLDIGSWSFDQWMLLIMRHIKDYHAPVILHPILLKRFYPYLARDASGHYQVGRGYDKNGKQPTTISYFEPWNQQRFDPSRPFIARVQWRQAYKSYRANQAHFLHNIGV